MASVDDGVAAPATWRVRNERPDDEQAVEQVVAAAFGRPEVVRLLAAMRRDHCWLGLSFVVEPAGGAGEVAGHICFTRGWLDAPDRLIEVLVLSPLSVAPAHQRQGAGSELVLRSFDALAERPEPVVFLEGDPRYYSRLGFRPGAELGFQRPSDRIPEVAFQVRPLPAYGHHVTGSNIEGRDISGRLVYPDVFWRYDSVGLRR
jgi:putative acetyltransferase